MKLGIKIGSILVVAVILAIVLAVIVGVVLLIGMLPFWASVLIAILLIFSIATHLVSISGGGRDDEK
ncbi:hypothetical protein [Listeria booriae]|uniref:hypothetical protein n=1 Tax=Listeria booriae TaxID=1552123 RepID=UPI001628A11C|nr:hypothetical protein [Listeria booriae]MBC2174749.1 hypothetical protein [Listeria booriae]